MTYSDQLKSPKWQKKRLEILNLRGFKCEECGNEDNQLHVHHRFYLKNRKAWEYDNDVFQVLCDACHEKHHKNKQNNLSQKEIDILNVSKGMIDNYFDQYFYVLQEINEYTNIIDVLSSMFNNGLFDELEKIVKDYEESENQNFKIFMLEEEIKLLKERLNIK